MGMFVPRRLPTRTASSGERIAACTRTPLAVASLIVRLTSSKSACGPATTMTSVSGAVLGSPSSETVTPIPSPCPLGVRGSCPIMVDSVMTVSVIVSMARPLITGVASLTRTSLTSQGETPEATRALDTARETPTAFLGVPFTPVVGAKAPSSQTGPSGPARCTAASVVELPMSTPTMTRVSSSMLKRPRGEGRSPPRRGWRP